jgi:hypothetical protein
VFFSWQVFKVCDVALVYRICTKEKARPLRSFDAMQFIQSNQRFSKTGTRQTVCDRRHNLDENETFRLTS